MTFVISYPDGATPLDPNERDGLKHLHITTQGELNELEQANIIAGLHWLERLRRPDVLSDAFALRLHKRLFGDVWAWGGKLRQTERNIGIDPCTSRFNCGLALMMRVFGLSVRPIRRWKPHSGFITG